MNKILLGVQISIYFFLEYDAVIIGNLLRFGCRSCFHILGSPWYRRVGGTRATFFRLVSYLCNVFPSKRQRTRCHMSKDCNFHEQP